MWTVPKDSVDRFTISYMKDLPFHVNDTAKDLGSYCLTKVSRSHSTWKKIREGLNIKRPWSTSGNGMIVKKAENSQVESCPARVMLEAEG